METLYYKTLIAVAELRSFSLAAERLNITQSTASRRIAFLEEHFEQKLLDRDGLQIAPTAAGLIVIDQAHRILSFEGQIDEKLAHIAVPSHVSIGCTANFAAIHLANLLSYVSDRGLFPHLTVSTATTDSLMEGIEQGHFDVAYLEHCGLPALSSQYTNPLPDDRVVFLSAHSSLQTGAVDVAELLRQTIYVCPTGCCTRKLLDKNLHASGYELNDFANVVDLCDLHVMLDTLLKQGGVAFLSQEIASIEFVAGRLTPHTVPGWQHSRQRTVVASDQETADTWRVLFERASAVS